jgi:hypothetical protein
VRAFAAGTQSPLIDVERGFEDNQADSYDESHFTGREHALMGRFVMESLEALGLLRALRER